MMEVYMEDMRREEGKVIGAMAGVVSEQRECSTWSSFSSWACKSSIPGGSTSQAGRLVEHLRSMGFAPLRN
jgi:hypothetical protein